MANHEVKTRFRLEGEQEFNRAIKDAASSQKVLNAEMKLAKAQFEETGDAQQYAADQARILKEQIEEQKKAVAAAEEAVKRLNELGFDKSSKVMQEWRQKLANSRTTLTTLQNKLKGVREGIGETDKAATDSKLANGINYANTIAAIDGITNAIEKIIKTAAKAAKAVWDMGVDAGKWADNLATAANEAGIDVEKYQSWQYASRFIDTSVDDIVKSWRDLDKHLNADKTGDDFRNFATAMSKVGVGVQTASGQIKQGKDLFWEVIDTLHTMGSETRWASYAMDIFGNDWRKLNPLITAGSRAYKDLATEGMSVAVVSKENVEALGAVDDAVQDMGARFDKFKYDTLAELAPTFETVAKALSDAIDAMNQFVQSEEGRAALEGLNEALSGLIESFLGGDNGKETFKKIVDDAKGAVSGFTKALSWIKDNGNAVAGIVRSMVYAWLGLKTLKGVLEFTHLTKEGVNFTKGAINGTKNIFSRLFGSKSASAESLDDVAKSFSDTAERFSSTADTFESAANTAKESAEAAKSSSEAAKSASESASSSSEAASSSSQAAESSSQAAESSSDTASSSASAAESSAETASSSAEAASSSSEAASSSSQAAESSSQAAESASDTASSNASAAESSAEAASSSADAASSSAEAAESSAEAADSAADAAANSKDAAKGSKEAAKASAGASWESAKSSLYSAIAAESSKSAAASSALAAGSAMDAAISAAKAAATSIETAANSAAAAAESALGAATSRALLEEQLAGAASARALAEGAAARAIASANTAALSAGGSAGAALLTGGGPALLGDGGASAASAASPSPVVPPAAAGFFGGGFTTIFPIGKILDWSRQTADKDRAMFEELNELRKYRDEMPKELSEYIQSIKDQYKQNEELAKAQEEQAASLERLKDARPLAEAYWDALRDPDADVDDVLAKFEALRDLFRGGGLDDFNRLKEQIEDLRWDNIGNLDEIKDLPDDWFNVGTDATEGLKNGLDDGLDDVEQAGKDLGNAVIDAAKGALDEHSPSKVMEVIGENASVGLANGIYNRADEAIQAAQWLADQVAATFQNALDIHSPSGVFEDFGEFTGIGYAGGVEKSLARVEQAVGKMVSAATTRPVQMLGGMPYGAAYAQSVQAAGRSASGVSPSDMLHVTLQVDGEDLADIMAPLINGRIGAIVQATRR